jgi:hypothetical protein
MVGAMVVPCVSTAADATARIDVNSAYVWRGITINDGLVVQPSIDVGATSNLSINVWGNFDIDDYDGAFQENEFSEVDLSATYSMSAGPVEMALAYSEYLYPHQGGTNGPASGSREVSLAAKTPVVGDLAVQGKLYYDVDEVDALYASLGLVYGMSFMDDAVSIEIGASAGCAEKKWAVTNSRGTEGGLHDYNVAAAVVYAPSETVEWGANIGYTDTLDEDVLPEQNVDLYGGVSVSVAF